MGLGVLNGRVVWVAVPRHMNDRHTSQLSNLNCSGELGKTTLCYGTVATPDSEVANARNLRVCSYSGCNWLLCTKMELIHTK